MQNTVTDWLDKTAEMFSDRLAIVDSDNEITWKQYRKKSLGIAQAIINKKYGIKKPIVVYGYRIQW